MPELVSTQALPAGTRLEEFVIERVLGSGGFGITYLARDSSLGRQVVIKENLPVQFCFRDTHSLTVAPRHSHGEDAENFQWSLENFSKEAAMLASLDHPGIVKVLRSFEAFGTAYFVMPFVEGLALDELSKQRDGRPFSEEELCGLLERMLAALGYLHDRGIYHRDIKPGNILITRENAPVLIDFGSARQCLSERSLTVIESPGYTPFEQLQTRGNIGPWSDLYALGATLVKVMTGEAPPKTNDRSFGDPWLPLAGRAELAGRFSKGFLTALDRSLKLPVTERWQDAGEWLAALRGEVALETPPPFRSENPSVSTEIPGKKVNHLPWIIAASVVLGIFALAKISSNKEASIQSERANAQAADARAKEADQRAARLEQEKQLLAKQQAEEKEALAAEQQANLQHAAREKTEAEKQRADREEQERQALVAAGKAKEEAEKQRAARAEQEQQALGAQAAAKAEMLKRALTGSKAGEQRDFEIAPGVKITMCWIPPGEFMMGSPAGEAEPYAKENQHRVTLTQGFWLAQTETTQAQWYAVMGAVVRENRSAFKGGNIPVESVSWNDVAGPGGFIDKVNKTAEGEDRFALPTEAQWEYACRAGTTGPYAGYLNQMAWYDKNSGIKTHPTAGKKANDWGLHDMHGNVWEWCADWYGVYPDGAAKDPKGSPFGIGRVSRGGSWNGSARNCRAASRNYFSSSGTYNYVGFRIARGLVP